LLFFLFFFSVPLGYLFVFFFFFFRKRGQLRYKPSLLWGRGKCVKETGIMYLTHRQDDNVLVGTVPRMERKKTRLDIPAATLSDIERISNGTSNAFLFS
ncbi:hypothetical protein, partial [Klebsiella pneumoniae]|uniref:hypothetical protein n=1 Tax=Klebsiella pneumoniae TaxID=573 RepID=UPI001F4A1A1D